MTSFADELLSGLTAHVASGHRRTAIVGRTSAAIELATASARIVGIDLVGIFDPDAVEGDALIAPWATLADHAPEIVVIADDRDKERLLIAAANALDDQEPLPQVVLAGLAHQDDVGDPIFHELESPALVPSYATGHPHTRAHLFNCLRAAATAGRSGAIVELGAFKGGTSVWLAKAARSLDLRDTHVIAFDAWDGFPKRRSILDLYEHPRCVFRDLDAVRRYTEPYGIELVAGDIFETAPRRLAAQPILLAFVDTDNYSGAREALATITPNLVVGGCVVFDHFHTTAEYAYTVGERLAARSVLSDQGLFHLHGTGVFVRLS